MFTGCFSTRHLNDGEQLLVKNTIYVNGKKNGSFSGQDEEFSTFIKQRPNRKIIGMFRFHLWLYNVVSEKKMNKQMERMRSKLKRKNDNIKEKNIRRIAKGKSEKSLKTYKPAWREKWRTIVGEAPVILDTLRTDATTKQIENYLFKKGYFDANADYSLKKKFLSKKKIKVNYHIESGNAYIISNFHQNMNDSIINSVVDELRNSGKIPNHLNQRIDIDQLDNERQIITNELNNLGFYEFNKEYISYQIDTSQVNKTAEVKQTLNFPKRRDVLEDSVKTFPHSIFKITKAKISIEPSVKSSETTIESQINGFEFNYIADKKVLSEYEILRNILFELNETYNQELVTQTRKRLSSMGLFEYVQVIFSKEDENSHERYQNLHCEIKLKLLKKQTLSAESKGTYTNGNYGIEGELSYINRNLFKGGEKLKLSVAGGLQTQQSFTSQDTSKLTDFNQLNSLEEAFNTFEIGPQIEFTLPRLIFFNNAFKNVDYTQTRFKVRTNYQRTPDYIRNIDELTYGYDWSIGKNTFLADVAEISFVDIDITNEEFNQNIFSRSDLFLANSFIDHVIVGSRFRYKYFTTTKRGKFYLDSYVEGVGNLLKLGYELAKVDTNANGNHEFLGIQFAQFVKLQTELRYHYHLSKSNDLAFRLNGGLGIPFKNSNYALPFERSFFIGGPNSLRAWKARTIGPGTYTTQERTFDKIGDIILEGNAEYRFEMTNTLEGAFFIDAGNIWLYDPNSTRIGGSFNPTTFVSEIALGSGFGLRFDFTYFLLRFDFSVPMKTPYLPIGQRWIFEERTTEEDEHFTPQLSFGIGYPF